MLLFSCLVVSGSLQPHGLQHTRLPCLSPAPRVYSNSRPLSVMPSNHLCCPFLLLPSIFPSIRVFSNESALRIRWPKYWSFSFSFSPSNEYSGVISLGLTGLISFLFKGLSTVQKHQFFSAQPSLWSNSHNLPLCIYLFGCFLKEASFLAVLILRLSARFSSVTQSCLTLWDPMDCSTPGLPVQQTRGARGSFLRTGTDFCSSFVHPVTSVILAHSKLNKSLVISW